jgi:hypothetical protein
MGLANMNNRSGMAFNDLVDTVCGLGYDGVMYSFYPKPVYADKHIQPILHFSDVLSPFVEHAIYLKR